MSQISSDPSARAPRGPRGERDHAGVSRGTGQGLIECAEPETQRIGPVLLRRYTEIQRLSGGKNSLGQDEHAVVSTAKLPQLGGVR